MNIGLTGGIATGKSTVSAMLVERGAILIDLDRIAREIVELGQSALAQIKERFGQAVIQEDGTLDRGKLGEIVFADVSERKALEQITHPAIRAVMKERMTAYERENPDKLVVIDVPLLFESRLAGYFERTLLVYVPRSEQKRRLMARDALTDEQAEKRLNAQMDIEQKRALADIVIDNGGSLQETAAQVDRFWRESGLS